MCQLLCIVNCNINNEVCVHAKLHANFRQQRMQTALNFEFFGEFIGIAPFLKKASSLQILKFSNELTKNTMIFGLK